MFPLQPEHLRSFCYAVPANGGDRTGVGRRKGLSAPPTSLDRLLTPKIERHFGLDCHSCGLWALVCSERVVLTCRWKPDSLY